ncbi:hypothetical protein HMPREF9952_0437 [Haemophilus pittmaniae HK 85]|uniref:Uncharacterized protein n=1 Tax=Haemophilus pittmaniae HK 85 TaxID=1035188 RepID=F9QAD7_9PAST|nr:hypothetical protein HMPREF9952_0437 [Haemophilus pittmaniae HK 85]
MMRNKASWVLFFCDQVQNFNKKRDFTIFLGLFSGIMRPQYWEIYDV